MRLALTGVTGFVGRCVMQSLREDRHDLIALVRDSGLSLGHGVRSARMDLANAGVEPSVLEGVDAVIHMAAFVPPSFADPAFAQQCMDVNALGTLKLAAAAAAAGVSTFVCFSSGNAYEQKARFLKESDPLFPANRATYYLASKVAGETFAVHIGLESGMRVVVLRPSSVYGPGMKGGLVFSIARCLLAGEEVRVLSGGVYTVDLVDVRDVVDATKAVLERDVGGAFNVGSGRMFTTLEVAHLMVSLAEGRGGRINVMAAGPKGADSGFSALDISRAKGELGYAPRDLRVGLADYLLSLGVSCANRCN